MEDKPEVEKSIVTNNFVRPKGTCVQCGNRGEISYFMDIALCDECWDEQELNREDGGDEYS